MNKDNVIICRCEDVSLKDLHDVLNEGYSDFETIKRILRVGMGPCQGNSCGLLVQREIAKFTKTPLNEVKLQKVRPLITGVKMKSIIEALEDES
jgi:bacterioferritin-associated ferredoxin